MRQPLPMGLRLAVAKGHAKRSPTIGSASAMQPGSGRCSQVSIDRMLGDHKLAWSPIFSLMGFVTRVLSPYEFNPANYNPLRDVVEQSIDFDVLQRPDCPVKLFLSATNVRTGKVKVFAGKEISARCRDGFGVSSHDVSRG